jgi:hypothetical protein
MMRARGLQLMTLLAAFPTLPGCLLNSVHRITTAPSHKPDSSHAIVVIGLGVDAVAPFPVFAVTLDEYSEKKQDITGNCFRYNRIEAERPSSTTQVTYYAFEVPAGIYVYSRRNVDEVTPASSMGSAFKAQAGKTVYFGNYVFVGHQSVEFRREIDAAAAGIKSLLPPGATLEPGEPTTASPTHAFICTP